MKNYILIDGSYFIFYRVFALQVWWKNAKPDQPLIDPFYNEEFVEKYIHTFNTKIQEIKKKLKLKDAIMIVGKDCPQNQIWRMKIYPQYKAGRNEEKNKEANIANFFKMTYEKQLFENSGINKIIKMKELEADDCLALTAKYLVNKYSDAKITIITSDHDYIQLANENINLYNLKYKSLLDSKTYTGCPKKDLFYKILLGDKSDNIEPVFIKCGKKTAEKCYEDNNYFLDKLEKEKREENYKRNKTLVDFNEIPAALVEIFYMDILSTLE